MTVAASSFTKPPAEPCKATIKDLGWVLGTAFRGSFTVYTTVEDTTIVIGPPRSGKGLYLVINRVLDAPGPVITTSTRPDVVTATYKARAEGGRPVAVFDPQGILEGIGGTVRWGLTRRCENADVAIERGKAIAGSLGLGASQNGEFWETYGATLMTCLVHAAALKPGGSARDVRLWSTDAAYAREAEEILLHDERAVDGWGQILAGYRATEPRLRSNIWGTAQTVTACLLDPKVLDAVCPGDDEAFDPVDFLRRSGTFYVLSKQKRDGGGAPMLISAFITDIVSTARRLASMEENGRLSPPLANEFDEIGNMTSLPILPSLMTTGGGEGICTTGYFQARAQLDAGWGKEDGETMWDSANCKLILGGVSSAANLREWCEIIGDQEHFNSSESLDRGGSMTNSDGHFRQIVKPHELRQLRFGDVMTIYRHVPPFLATLPPYTGRPGADVLAKARKEYQQQIREARRKGAVA